MSDNELNNNPTNGWGTWAKHVLKEQKRLSVETEGCREAIATQNKEIAELRAALSGYMARVKDLYRDASVMSDGLTQFKIDVNRELAVLQTKSGVWGAIGALVVLLLAWLMSRFGG